MIKHTVAFILMPAKQKANGLFPIYLKMTINRKSSFISTGISVAKSQWNAKDQQVKGHPMHESYNMDLSIRKQEVLKKIIDKQVSGGSLSAPELKGMFTGADMHNIFDFVDVFKEEVKGKREAGTLENYRKHLKKLEEFHGSRSLSFEQIDGTFLSRYENELRQTVGENYVHGLFKTLKTFFNAARKRGLISHYPFSNYENPVYKAPVKDYLTMPELKAWEKYTDEVTDPVIKQAAIYFLFGCYTGLRVSDWRRFDPIKNIKAGKILIQAKKNEEWVSMPISNPCKRNLEKMKELPLTIEEPTINEKLKVIAGKLELGKRITSHTGRHTFAVTVCLFNKISSETTARLMGITLATFVENYSQVTQEKIDKEARAAWKNM